MASIRLATAANVRGFQNLSHALISSNDKWSDSIQHDGLQDEIGRFRVWSGNLGALQKGHSSLDYRLRDSPLLSTNALQFLKELESNVNEARAIVSGDRLPYELQPKPEKDEEEDDDDDGFFDEDEDEDEDDAGGSRTELSMRFAEVVDIIDNLYKLSVRIRTPTIRSRSLKAATYKPKDPETGIDILDTYAAFDLQHTQELLRQLQQPHQDESHDGDFDYLITRLSAAITLRRRQFKYWRRHRDKLGISTVAEEHALHDQPVLIRPNPLQRNDTLEAHPDLPVILNEQEAPSHKTGKTLLSGTEATQHHQSLDELVDTKSVTSYAVTVKDLHGKGVELPPPPRAADGEKDFECPYCYIICPARYGRGRAWRTHLLQDLQPYICTYPECDNAEQLFRSRREWVAHEASHRKAWRCPEHPTAIYKSSAGLEDHLRREHSESLPASQLPAIVRVGETTTVDVRPKCPICCVPSDTEGLGDFHNHVANHLERIATFALPIGTEDESDGVSDRGRSESSESRNMSGLSLPSDTTHNSELIEKIDSTLAQTEHAVPINSNALRKTQQAVSAGTLSAESLHQLPDATQNRLETLLAGRGTNHGDSTDTQDTDTTSSVYSGNITDDNKEKEDHKAQTLDISDIPTLRSLYRSRRLLQRDQSFAPNDTYNQLISFCYHDMTRLKVDAIVNVSNRAMKETKGWTLNSAIHKAAGPALARETKPMGKLEKEAVLTGGHNLPSKHVIHVARPGYSSSEGMGQFNQLVDCYRCAFKVAFDNQLKTIAFPCMGTGGVGFPSRVAARIALQEVREYLDAHSDHKLERIIFCVNTAANEQAYIDFFPVYFPPTHDDLEAARSSIWSEDRGAVARQVLDTRNEIQKISVDLKRGLSLSVPDFPEGVLGRLSAMDLALASIRRYLLWSNELNKNLRDLKLVCSVVQLFCGNIAEIIDLAKDHASLGQRSDKSIWDEYVSDMNDRHKMDPLRLLNLCCKFIQGLDHMITRDGVELVDMSDLRQKLERYKVKQRGARDAEGTQDHLNEVLYTREFQRQTIAQSRDTVRLHQIQSMSQLYKLGELEEKPTLAHPSAMFNHTICLAREDITKLEVDVMVNSTDKTFGGIGTLDRTVFLKGGVGLREAVKAFGQGKEGDVRLTGGYLLPAKHLLHIIPPELYRKDTKDILRKIYREILHTAVMLRATSIALPSIGTGMLNYPRRDCASLALEEVKRFLESAEPTSLIEKIIFVVYSSNDEFVYKTLLPVYFPPIDLNINRALPASITRQNTSATTSSEPSETPRRALFGSVGEALRSVRFGKLPEISRPITANEEHALICFESHAKDCKTCNDVTKLYLEGRDLCKDGYSFAQTVLLHMNMQSDQNVYTKPDIKGQSVRLEIPGDMYPISMSLLALVEKSYRDGDRSRPFVTPNRPYGAIVQDQRPDITAFQGIPRRARAHILTKSQAEDQWTAMASGECQIKVYPSQIFISELDAVEGDQTPLVWLELDASALVQRHMTTPEVTLVGATRLQSNLQTKDDVLFRCRNDNECNSLLRMIRRALDDLIEGQAGIPASTGEHEQRSTDDYPKWNQRIRDISEELASVKRVTGGLTDLQFKMERLGAATSSLSTNSPQASAASKLYDASRSLLATRVLVCLTADIKSRPGSYIGLGIDSIVSALRSDRTKVLLALKELEAEDQVHNTVDTDTWVVTHLPKDLPVLSTEQIETASQQVSFSRDQQPGFSQSEAKHATYVSGGTAGTSNIGPPAYIHDKPRSHRIEPPLSLLATWIVSHIPFETTSSNELVLFREIASRQKTTVEEVERAMAEVQAKTKWFYDSDAPTSPHLEPGLVITASYTELNLWTCIDRSIVDPGILREIGVDFEDRGSDLLLHRALEKGELVEWTRRTREARQLPQEVEQDRSTEGTSATVIRDTPSFTDTPPSPIAGPSTSSTDQLAPLHLDTINIDDFFSYSNPPGTRWTRVDKRLIDASVLIAAEEEYEDVGDSLIVHRVLRRGEIRRWAEQSREVREALVRFQEGEKRKWEETSEGIREVMRVLKEREGEGIREEVGDDGHSLREASGGRRERRDDREVKGKGKDERDEYQERLDRVIAGDMKEEEMRRFADRDDERYL